MEEEDFVRIEELLDGIIGKAGKKETIDKLKNEAYMYPGEAGKRVADALLAIKDGLPAPGTADAPVVG
jgi:hypothetical protein